MLFRMNTLDGIKEGRISMAFRKWKRPTVKSGGTLLTRVGKLSIDAVDMISESELTGEQARRAGYESLSGLKKELGKKAAGQLYRISFHLLGPDPRIALRRQIPDRQGLEKLTLRLERLDRASPTGPWTIAVLKLIHDKPAVRAGDLAAEMVLERDYFKQNVRKLKRLGLTESLAVGYRLSPRGATLFKYLLNRE